MLWFDVITVGSVLPIAELFFLKRENPEPILTVKRIEWSKLIGYFGVIIESDPFRVVKKNVYFFILGIYQYLHLVRPI